MIGTIRKHQTWLWAIIITLTVISFVWYFSPYSKMNAGRTGPVNYGSINGERITKEQFDQAVREMDLQYFFRNGSWPTDDEARKREAYQWLLLIQEQEKMGIHISS